MSRKERCTLNVVQVSNFDEAAAMIRDGMVEAAFIVEPYHDNPPGDWYIKFEIFCAGSAVAIRVERVFSTFSQTKQREGLLFIDGYLMTHLSAGREVIRRPEEETPEFLASWAPEVAEKAAFIVERLSRV